jgi:hypothetical protein
MDKVGALGLIYRDKVDIDATQAAPPINGSYREFSKPFYRSVGIAPDKGTAATTSRINDTIAAGRNRHRVRLRRSRDISHSTAQIRSSPFRWPM